MALPAAPVSTLRTGLPPFAVITMLAPASPVSPCRTTTVKSGRNSTPQLALAVAQANSCEYCLSAHSTIGKMVGLKPEEIAASRQAHSADPKRDAGLQFVQLLVVQRGMVSDQDVARVKAAGYTDGEIVELVANTAINIFTNYFNHVARTDVDFPPVPVAIETVAA